MTPQNVKDIVRSVALQVLSDYAGTGKAGSFIDGERQDESYLSSFKTHPLIALMPFEWQEDYTDLDGSTTLEIRATLLDTLDSSTTARSQLMNESYKILQMIGRALTNSKVQYPDGSRDVLTVGKANFAQIVRENSAIATGYKMRFPFEFPIQCQGIDFTPNPLEGAFLLLEEGGYIRLEDGGRIVL